MLVSYIFFFRRFPEVDISFFLSSKKRSSVLFAGGLPTKKGSTCGPYYSIQSRRRGCKPPIPPSSTNTLLPERSKTHCGNPSQDPDAFWKNSILFPKIRNAYLKNCCTQSQKPVATTSIIWCVSEWRPAPELCRWQSQNTPPGSTKNTMQVLRKHAASVPKPSTAAFKIRCWYFKKREIHKTRFGY